MTDSAPRTDSRRSSPGRRGVRRHQQRARRLLPHRRRACWARSTPTATTWSGIGITRSGRWVVVDPRRSPAVQIVDGQLPEISEDRLDAMLLRDDDRHRARRADRVSVGRDRRTDLVRCPGSRWLDRVLDVAFSLLHGPFGEDGTIQGLFEMMGTRYVGAGVLASAVGHGQALHEARAGRLPGCRSGRSSPIPPREWARDRAACLEAVAALHYPVYVKPARGGSSLGITRVESSADGWQAAIELAQRVRPEGDRRAGLRRRPRARVRGARRTWDGEPRGQRGRRDPGAQRVGLLRLRGQVPPRGAGRPRRAGRRRRRDRRGGAVGWRSGRSRRSAARAWPGWTSS